jgi:signal peptidase II
VLAGSSTLTNPPSAARVRYYVVIIATAVIVIGVDHITKWLVVSNIPLFHSIGGNDFISLHHVENSGAAFGLFPQFQGVYLVVAGIVALYILFAGHIYGTTWGRQMVLGLILGGAVSNGVDRLTQGHVVDFIDLHWWPVFNVADMSIVIGILIAVLQLGRRRAAPQRPAA